MQQQLHTILCHPERSEGSHSLIYKLPHWLIFSFLFISLSCYAQPYQWQWAINGGSVSSMSGTSWHLYAEQIYDVAIDKNNNYYFVANITTGGTPLLNGQPVTVYGNPNVGNDILLFSTTCNGTVRWSQAIGGGGLLTLPIK